MGAAGVVRGRAAHVRELGQAPQYRAGPGACGRGSCWPARRAAATWRSPRGWASTAARSASGGRVSWRDRLDGLADEPRPGVPRTITDTQVEEAVVRTLEEVPAGRHALAGSGSWPGR